MLPVRLAYPPVWFLLSVGLAYAAARFFPTPWPTAVARFADGAGVLSFAIGLGCFAAAALAFRRHATTIMPFSSPTRLITGGVFRFTRNPIYLGELFLLAGMCLHLGQSLPWIALPLFFGVMNGVTIPWEEAACRRIFGPAFDAYCRHTRRWL